MTSVLRPEQSGDDFERSVFFTLQRSGAVVERGVCVGVNCYGLDWRNDFVIRNAVAYPTGLVVECKYQEANGTADEKYPYTVASIRCLPCPALIVVGGWNARLDGKGARPAAVEWMRREIDGKHLLGVLSNEQLRSWLRRISFSPRLFP